MNRGAEPTHSIMCQISLDRKRQTPVNRRPEQACAVPALIGSAAIRCEQSDVRACCEATDTAAGTAQACSGLRVAAARPWRTSSRLPELRRLVPTYAAWSQGAATTFPAQKMGRPAEIALDGAALGESAIVSGADTMATITHDPLHGQHDSHGVAQGGAHAPGAGSGARSRPSCHE